jgi:hypothetical protein
MNMQPLNVVFIDPHDPTPDNMVTDGLVAIEEVAKTALPAIYRKMVADNTLNTVFYDHHNMTEMGFIRLFKDTPMYHIHSLHDYDSGVFWLTGQHNAPFIHFTLFKEVWGEDSVTIAKRVLNLLLDNFGINIILASFPTVNSLLHNWVHKVGFVDFFNTDDIGRAMVYAVYQR